MLGIVHLSLFILSGCAPSYKPIYMSQEEFQKNFGNTFISTCVRQCSGGNFKSLYDAKNWYGLAYAEYTTGSYDDLGFYYMGLAAENLNFKEMSQKYYEAALRNSGKSGCGTKSSGCDGFSFPADIYTKLDKFAQQQGHPNYQAKLASDKAALDADLKKRAAAIAEDERKQRAQMQAAKDAEAKRKASLPKPDINQIAKCAGYLYGYTKINNPLSETNKRLIQEANDFLNLFEDIKDRSPIAVKAMNIGNGLGQTYFATAQNGNMANVYLVQNMRNVINNECAEYGHRFGVETIKLVN